MRRFIMFLLLACSLNAAHAGRNCEVKKTSVQTFVSGMKLAENTRAALEASGAQVAIIGRVGQDLSAYGLRYSHAAYVWRDHPKGTWLVVHELNQCGTASSGLYDQGLANFFLDDLYRYEAVVLIPSAQSQSRIAGVLGSYVANRMHYARYNMLAYPFSTEYQNSNQWVLETYAASTSDMGVQDRGRAQAWLRAAGYTPTTLDIPATKRLGARMFSANISFDDHPFARRAAGRIDTVTVESVLNFVRQREPGTRELLVTAR
ncbi:DUF2145 domain-containing protein [Massilia sp. CF038]|uniref:DUF2145 domain-containing protein n=1 Tax=Massilia sp. CF038 TaxID=1881045 RepID=UPI00090ECA95|nr:DUF2145 domain-containing protein [Massilia sp. CF038]SHG51314.1 hypothetical protein SAMN05428948_0805 [Massilia sp. CF038]